MLKIIAFAAFSFVCLTTAVAQNNFEGKVTYRLSFSSEKENSVIEALFGDQKIKVLVKPSSSSSSQKEDLILDFKNGIFYKITNKTKTYTIDSFKKSNNDIFASAKTLVPVNEKNTSTFGYKSTAYTLPADGQNNLPMANIKVILWYADSMRFQVPEEFASVEMVPLFTNGSTVGLGMKMLMQLEENKNDSSQFTVLAVEPQKIPDSLLALPPDFTLVYSTDNYNQDVISPDTTMVIASDSVAAPALQLKPAKRSAKKPAGKKPNSGKKIIENKPKTPAKKPDN
ncbi:MAG: hypothetical protein ABIQ31_23505 [Ferruginibacter sp.]